MTRAFESADELVDALLARVGKRIVLGLPIGIGKAVHVVDALFNRALADDSISLTIFTGLTLETPRGSNELERRFLGPLVERLYADCPVPAYATALRTGRLPANVDVREFYLRPGAWLGNPLAQQRYTSVNYSQVAAELDRLGVNVIAQLVSARAGSPGRYSLAANPEITLDLLPALDARRRAGDPVAVVGQVNRNLPYMTGDAELDAGRFDFVLECGEFPLFQLPNRKVSPADYATAMHVASLVPDGGTLQVGIGSLSDAVAHCLILRHEAPDVFAEVLARLPGGSATKRRAALPVETGPFERGLFASSELLSDALFALFRAGILKRGADAADPAVVHAGFFIGSNELYENLRALPEDRRRLIRMTRISETNTLFGDEARKRRQRTQARFVNETMMATLLGAVVSDGLEDGRVVSGVGGQFDFVSMAHALDGAHSILMLRARRLHEGRPRSNIRWHYGHVTIPRHYRDVFVSEYGIAATRGLPDSRVIAAMLGIADSTFQDELARAAVDAGKLERDYRVPQDARDNVPAAIAAVFGDPDFAPRFPPYPLGTVLTPAERRLVDALGWLGKRAARPFRHARGLATALVAGGRCRDGEALARMQLAAPRGLRERVMQRLVGFALDRGKEEIDAG
ncbi:MAG: acetyl-CoA hydrolase/transferase C-terminal domain-containing protein [Woeseiaceae bacterium]|nr:acetyl-CoA hydrolase/transferase C-terminal domain-containing protein [Woeseiaceae bacterium]